MRKLLDPYKIKPFKRKLKFLALIINSLDLAVVHYEAQGFGLLGDWGNHDLSESKSQLLEWDQGSSGNCKQNQRNHHLW